MNNHAVLKCFIVEDEPLAADALSRRITEEKDLELTGIARTGREAVAALQRERPDILFLDVQIPDFSGVDVLRQLDQGSMRVIFTTAYDIYAITAFELGAVDYLLKPFGKAEFARAIERVRALRSPEVSELLARLGESDKTSTKPLERIYVHAGARIIPVNLGDITRFEAEDGLVTVRAGAKIHHLSISLKNIEQRLDPVMFVRVRRSCIINLKKVRAVRRGADRRCRLDLGDGGEVVASREHSKALRRLFRTLRTVTSR